MILLVRHGQSTWNAERRWQGQADPPLSALGEHQAQTAAQALRELDARLDHAVTSPLRRAARTAELLAAAVGLPDPARVPGLMERGAGPWEGLTHAEIDARHPGARASGRRPPGYEPEAALVARATAALRALPPGRVLVVAHEGVIRALERAAGAQDLAPMPNLTARWFTRELAAEGPRLLLATSAPPSSCRAAAGPR